MRRALGLILAACLATAAHADPLADLAAAQKATIEAWGKVPFSQQNVTFISEASSGYGVYKARSSNVFKQANNRWLKMAVAVKAKCIVFRKTADSPSSGGL